MKASKVKIMLVLALGFAGLGVSSVMADELGINFSDAYFAWPLDGYEEGWEFLVTSPVTVDGLASATHSGFMSGSIRVGLWTVDGTKLLAYGAVPDGTPVIPGTEFAEVAISPITLNPGYYVVASVGSGSFTGEGLFTGMTVAPGIQYVTDEWTTAAGSLSDPYEGLVFPTRSDGLDASDAGYFGGNIVLSESVPDVSSSLMLLSGVCMALDMLRRKLQS